MTSRTFVSNFTGLVFAFGALLFAGPAWAKPSIGSVTPGTANRDVAVTFSANVNSAVSIQSCNLYVDLADAGAMTVSGGVASKPYTFNSGGSRIAFVFCRDTSGGMAAGPNTSIWVGGAIVTTPPLSVPEPTPAPTPTPITTPTPTPVVTPITVVTPTPTPTVTTAPEPTPMPVITPAESPEPDVALGAQRLIKLTCGSDMGPDHPCRAIYYFGTDGKRHAFPNEKVYFTWYDDFSKVKEISLEAMSLLPLGKNVTYRAGSRMVKFTTDPKVYAVSEQGTLRWVKSEELAIGLYGGDWNKKIDDIADVFYSNYDFGDEITNTGEYNASAIMTQAATIDTSY